MTKYPRKLEVGQSINGVHYEVWCYNKVPEGMRHAYDSDLKVGAMILYEVEVGPEKGLYYTAVVTWDNMMVLRSKMAKGMLFVKDR